MSLEDTIAAIATPSGHSGIGIVRMSGKRSFPIAQRIFQPPEGKKVNWSSSFRIYYGWIVDPDTGNRVDEVLLTLMRAPKTYTREDIVEINCHGGPVPLRRTLELTLKLGARLAEPGEFTKRAFLRGRIDLVQAESVLDIIQARTEKSLEAALNALGGKLSQKIFLLKGKMVDLLSYLEAEIDFSSEDLEFLSRRDKEERLKEILKDVDSLLEATKMGQVYKEGVKAVIVGKPNVGKSSLLNTLLQRERAIVSYVPGTTRDTIEEMVNIKGFPVWIADTAGLKETKNIIEKEGIARTHLKMEEADIVLLRKEEISSFSPGREIVEISATKEINIDKLKEKLANFVLKKAVPRDSDLLVMNLRQKKTLEETREGVKRALGAIKQGLSEELVAFDLREGIDRLGQITGEVVTDEILDHIFSHFCIGK